MISTHVRLWYLFVLCTYNDDPRLVIYSTKSMRGGPLYIAPHGENFKGLVEHTYRKLSYRVRLTGLRYLGVREFYY